MTVKIPYIRETRSMKASPIENEEEFKAKYPDGKFVYFDAASGEPMDEVDLDPVPDVTDAVAADFPNDDLPAKRQR